MGLAMGRLLGLSYRLTKQLEARRILLMLGLDLDAAGNTTILYKLKMAEELGLQSLGNNHRRWHIQSASATSGEGLYEGLDWLCTNVNIKVE